MKKKKIEPDWVQRNRERSNKRYHRNKMKYNILIVFSFAMFCCAFAFYFKYQDAKQFNAESIKSLQHQSDSLRDELFSTEVELTRYQITLENMDSITKQKFETFLYTQTE
jgi:hypothetical protein